MGKKAELHFDGKIYDLPVVSGTEKENAIDISTLRAQSGLITLDRGFKNTGSTQSAITFLNGEEGILRYRGYSIEDLCEKASFLEWYKKFMKKILNHLTEKKSDRIDQFKIGAKEFQSFIKENFDDFTIYTPKSFDNENSLIISYYKGEDV